jgi:hypothetical protein
MDREIFKVEKYGQVNIYGDKVWNGTYLRWQSMNR